MNFFFIIEIYIICSFIIKLKKLDEKKSVFVGNLAFDEQEETLWKAFSDCGEVVNVRIIRDAKTNLGKGNFYLLYFHKLI